MSDEAAVPNLARRRKLQVWLLLALLAVTLALAVPAFFSTANADQVGPNVLRNNCDNDVDVTTAQQDGEPCAFDNGLSGAISELVALLGLTALGVAAARKQPENPTGVILIVIALLEPWISISKYVADWVFVRGEAPQWIGTGALLLSAPAIPGSFFLIGLFVLLFPTGKPVHSLWRIVGWVGAYCAIVNSAQVFNPMFFSSDVGDVSFYFTPGTSNPIGIEAIPTVVWDGAFEITIGVLLIFMLVAVVALFHRFWRATGDERQQLKVVGIGVVGFAVFALVAANLNPLGGVFSWVWDNNIIFLVLILFPSFAVALLKYRLYDIDVVVNRALVYGLLIALIALVISIIAFVPFIILGADETDATGRLALPFIATLVAVVLAQPVKDRLQKFANRVVYGRRATPYEALSQFSASIAQSPADEGLLAEMAAILAQGTGAENARVWVVAGDEFRLTASQPDSSEEVIIPMGDDTLEIDGASAAVPVTHRGELLGAISVTKRPGDPVRAIERRLLTDLASQAGVVLRNFRLTEELLERLEELRASRQRIVAAQDEERRRLERNLHDGAQQQLVALKIKLRILEQVDDPERRHSMLEALMHETDEAIQGLRDLARGIYPPMLAEEGLVRALRSQASKAVTPVEVEAHRVGRYSAEVEAAVYFCTLEALQNVTKYAGADSATVLLEADPGSLHFEISDNGAGFDASTTSRGSGLQNMEDRIEALGGSIVIKSGVGIGTVVSGTVPIYGET